MDRNCKEKREAARTPPALRRKSGFEREAEACAWLENKGWQILARNIYFSFGELDIVARQGDAIIAVEVRSVGSGARIRAAESVSRTKILRLRRSLSRFLHADPRGRACMPWVQEIRIDLLTFSPEEGWQHFEGIRL